MVIDSLSAHVAILDEAGVIIETNRSWQEFGKKNKLTGPADSVGINYLFICDQASKNKSEEAGYVARGIRVAALVRAGKMSKDIAEVLGVSVSAVDFHRKSIRLKLGLNLTGTNLRSYLLYLV